MPAEQSKQTKKLSSQPTSIFGSNGPRHSFDKKERPQNLKDVILKIWRFLRKERYLVILCIFLVVCDSCTDMAGPILLSHAIDKCIIPRKLHELAITACAMLALGLGGCFLYWSHSFIMAGVAQRTVSALRAELFEKLQSLSLPFFDKNPHGDLMSRFTNDIDNVNQVLSNNLTQIVFNMVAAVGIAITMLILNPILGGVCIASVLTMSFIVNFILAKRIRALFRVRQSLLGSLNGTIEETISGQKTIKAIHREQMAIEDFEKSNRNFKTSMIDTETFAGSIGPMMNFTNNISMALVVITGGVLALKHLTTIGMIAAFTNYVRMFSRPLNDMANVYNALQSALAGAERVFHVIEETPETDASEDAEPVEIKGEVSLENVTFSYVEGQPVLKNVSLHANPGDTIALVGPTGAGKTTIINLLTRFYEIDDGTIKIDGRDITQMRKESLRKQLGIVLQGAFLFMGTVRENIRYGRLDATDEEIEAAAKLANADRFIRSLPQGYDTPLSERGSNLSQGQQQLLSIARAILADPSILILDEATSNVDTRTEKHIQDAMLKLMTGRTSFVIAHRLSTIREATQILVIKGGEIIQRGTHQQLLTEEGFYQRLYAGQIDDADEMAEVA
jgi:ATP-binding cassette subfamily B protein